MKYVVTLDIRNNLIYFSLRGVIFHNYLVYVNIRIIIIQLIVDYYISDVGINKREKLWCLEEIILIRSTGTDTLYISLFRKSYTNF